MVRSVTDLPLRVLFLDPDVLVDQDRLQAAWAADGPTEGDVVREVYASAIDPVRIAKLNDLLARVPDLTIVFMSTWSRLWTAGGIGGILQAAGYEGTRFSSVQAKPIEQPTTKISSWLDTAEACGLEIGGYAVWADECPEQHEWHRTVFPSVMADLIRTGPLAH